MLEKKLSNDICLEVNVVISWKNLSCTIFNKKNYRKRNEPKTWELTVWHVYRTTAVFLCIIFFKSEVLNMQLKVDFWLGPIKKYQPMIVFWCTQSQWNWKLHFHLNNDLRFSFSKWFALYCLSYLLVCSM